MWYTSSRHYASLLDTERDQTVHAKAQAETEEWPVPVISEASHHR